MKKVLILSVGGSSEPIINAIKINNPDYVYFFCSTGHRGSQQTVDGPGDPCGDKRISKCPACSHEFYLGNPKGKSIAIQTGLDKSQYDIIVVADPDDLNDCYAKLLELANKIDELHGRDLQIVANYTGGTKTMSVALALVGLVTEKWDLCVNLGPRTDLIKVKSGDVPIVIDKWNIFSQTQIESVRRTIKKFDYAHAAHVIAEILQRPLEKAFRDKLIEAMQLCQAFNNWDKFAHDKALGLLEIHGRGFSKYIIILKKILGQLEKRSGYELVGDLLNNAERKARRAYYDDAVGRLYRATELFAQIRLKIQYGYDTSNILLTDLPENLQREYETRIRKDNKLILGLKEGYELLAGFKDPIGKKYNEEKKQIENALTYRNNSIFAHGLRPLGEADYRYVKKTIQGFIENASKTIGTDFQILQLPREGIL